MVQPKFCFTTRVEAPFTVLVVGVMVTVPAPRFSASNEYPAVKPVVVACGNVTAMALALLNVTSLPASVVSKVYDVPVCALMGCEVTSVVAVAIKFPPNVNAAGEAVEPLPLPSTVCVAIVAMPVNGKFVPLVRLTADGVPKAGVVKEGLF